MRILLVVWLLNCQVGHEFTCQSGFRRQYAHCLFQMIPWNSTGLHPYQNMINHQQHSSKPPTPPRKTPINSTLYPPNIEDLSSPTNAKPNPRPVNPGLTKRKRAQMRRSKPIRSVSTVGGAVSIFPTTTVAPPHRDALSGYRDGPLPCPSHPRWRNPNNATRWRTGRTGKKVQHHQ